MARFARIGVGARQDVRRSTRSPRATRKALEDGMPTRGQEFNELKETQLDTGKKTSADGFRHAGRS